MEFLLNLAWVLVSTTLMAFCLPHFRRQSRRSFSPWMVACALLLVAILLFPAISITDDLNPTIFAVEDSARRNHSALVLHWTQQPVGLPLAFLSGWFEPVMACFTRQQLLSEPLPDLPILAFSLSGRSPPTAV